MIKIEVEKRFNKYLKEISDKIMELTIQNEKRYFAYMIELGDERCEHNGFNYVINYRHFNSKSFKYLLEARGYTVVDTAILKFLNSNKGK